MSKTCESAGNRVLRGLALASMLWASTTAAQTPELQTRMGAEQFSALGLHKLDASELAGLTRWIETQAPDELLQEAREAGRREAEQAPVSARAVTAPEPVSSSLIGRFEGFARGREYTLANGQVWKQVGESTLQGGLAEDPAVEISPARLGTGWLLRVAGYNARVRVERVR
ncbi:MAG: hypothetical protein ACJ8GV_12120 [Luteimonas sp.]